MSSQDNERTLDERKDRLRGPGSVQTLREDLLCAIQERDEQTLVEFMQIIREHRHVMTADVALAQAMAHALQVDWAVGYEALSERDRSPLMTPTLLTELNEAGRFHERDRLLDGAVSGVAYEVGNLRSRDDRTDLSLLLKLYFEHYEQKQDGSLQPLSDGRRGPAETIRSVGAFTPASETSTLASVCDTQLGLLESETDYERIEWGYKEPVRGSLDTGDVFEVLFTLAAKYPVFAMQGDFDIADTELRSEYDGSEKLEVLFDSGAPANQETVRQLIVDRERTLKPLLETCVEHGFNRSDHAHLTSELPTHSVVGFRHRDFAR